MTLAPGVVMMDATDCGVSGDQASKMISVPAAAAADTERGEGRCEESYAGRAAWRDPTLLLIRPTATSARRTAATIPTPRRPLTRQIGLGGAERIPRVRPHERLEARLRAVTKACEEVRMVASHCTP
jgi:hypothetical protein